MKHLLAVFACSLLASSAPAKDKEKTASSPADALVVTGGGTFAKAKILGKMDKLAIAQYNVRFKQATTVSVTKTEKKFNGFGRSNGASATGSVTAYLETSDGELTPNDFQEVADYGYSYLQAALKHASLDTVAWSAIAATDMYREGAEEEAEDRDQEQNRGQWWTTAAAHHGNTMYKRNALGGFAFGKAKRAARLADETGGAGAYLNLTVDFADIDVNVDVKTTGYRSTFTPSYNASVPVTNMSTKTQVTALMKVAANGGLSMLYDAKNVAEAVNLVQDIPAEMDYHTELSQDPARAKKRSALFSVSLSTKLETAPVVITTTRDKYKAAAKKALEHYADAWVAKIRESRS